MAFGMMMGKGGKSAGKKGPSAKVAKSATAPIAGGPVGKTTPPKPTASVSPNMKGPVGKTAVPKKTMKAMKSSIASLGSF